MNFSPPPHMPGAFAPDQPIELTVTALELNFLLSALQDDAFRMRAALVQKLQQQAMSNLRPMPSQQPVDLDA